MEIIHAENNPSCPPTEKPAEHPEDRLHTQIGSAILVPDELRAIGQDDWKGTSHTAQEEKIECNKVYTNYYESQSETKNKK